LLLGGFGEREIEVLIVGERQCDAVVNRGAGVAPEILPQR